MTTDQSSLGSNVVDLFSKSMARGFEDRESELESHMLQLGGEKRDHEMAEPDHPTREEMNAKLEATEARLEVRFAQIDGKLDRLADRFDNVVENLGETRREVKASRTTIIVAVVGSVLTALAVLYTAQSGLLQAFQTGLTAQSAQSVVADTPAVSPSPPE